jgi:crotonobetainyl-CoA:carnitine CoA-transferase CaiB-like acyl-CoA transferase
MGIAADAARLKPLSGITVVSIEQALAAPLCTCRLADAGARVIKVERPEGDFARGYDSAVHGVSSYVVWTNRGKESLVLDLKQAEDLALLQRILGKADVFVQNLAPGAADRLGLASEDLRHRYPQLVTCDITGYGDGPYQDMKAYDFLVQCESGLVSVSGAPGAPGRFGVSICDIGAGMNAAQGVITALLHRERTGEATGVTVSLFDTATDWMSVPLAHLEHGGKAPEPVGMRHPSMAPYGAYLTADDHQIVIAVQNNREWARLCSAVLLRPELADDARFATNNDRVAHRSAVDEVLDRRFGELPLEELRKLLDRSGIAYGAVNSVEQLSAHPQLRRWPMTVNGHDVSVVAPPLQTPFDDHAFRPVPAIGQDTDALRAEFSA